MFEMVILIVIFLVMLVGPLLSAAYYYKKNEGEILFINQNHIRDVRYFGKSFAKKIDESISTINGTEIVLSKKEVFTDGDSCEELPKIVENMIICQKKDFTLLSNVEVFMKEIYCADNIIINKKNVELRAAYSKKNIFLGDNTNLIRWIDAEDTVVTGENCLLGISISSGKQMCIGKGSEFKRIFSPIIYLGQDSSNTVDWLEHKNPAVLSMPAKSGWKRSRKYISKKMIDEKGVVAFSVLSWYNITVTESIVVQGDIRTHKGIRLCDNVSVCGNIFAEGDVKIGKNCFVLGNIFTQGNIYVGENSVVGSKGKIVSVVARNNITIEKNVIVFGYISCENEGKIVKGNHEHITYPKFLNEPDYLRTLKFKDINEYNNLSEYSFRKEKELELVVIPEGAEIITDSMFYACKKLKDISLPSSLKSVGDYAFADCSLLYNIEGWDDTQIETIGTAAFSKCAQLESFFIPNSILTIGAAAFSGCENLKKISFDSASQIKYIGDHCFRGCKSLEAIEIPMSVEYIGVSAFFECNNLKKITVSNKCKSQQGIIQLMEENHNIDISFIGDEKNENIFK